jgi:octaprenyl-diphosphate synthase
MFREEALRLAYQPIRQELASVEAELKGCRPDGYGMIADSVDYVLGTEGKRIRPALVILVARACGHSGGDGAVQMAAAAELFHTATLVTDDILDVAQTRRGRLTVNTRWSTEAAVLSAQYLYLSALKLTSKVGLNGNSRDLSRLMLETAGDMLSGEIRELDRGRSDGILTEQQYIEVVKAKTGSLFSACSRAGAMLAEADSRVQGAMLALGENLGIAFQIADDVLDLTADEGLLGKPVGADVRMGRMTLPFIHHLRASGRNGLKELLSLRASGEEVESFRFVLERSGSIEYSLRRAAQHAAKAEDALNVLSESAYRRSLKALSRYAVERDR